MNTQQKLKNSIYHMYLELVHFACGNKCCMSFGKVTLWQKNLHYLSIKTRGKVF
jgi:hypothetical protein